jgi:vacuolar-type H+-ATPase subunit H
MTLKEILSRPGSRPQVIRDCEQIINDEVGSKGLTGLPIKAAYAVVKTIKPGFIPEVIDGLLDDFADRLDPLYQAAKTKNEPISAYFCARAGEAAEALLGITDQRAQRAKNQVVKTAYEKMRPMAKKHTEAAIPRVSKMIAKHDAAAPATPVS